LTDGSWSDGFTGRNGWGGRKEKTKRRGVESNEGRGEESGRIGSDELIGWAEGDRHVAANVAE